jgi:streptogramin lyase
VDTTYRSRSRWGRHLFRQFCVFTSLMIGLVLVGTVLLWARAQALVVEMPPAEPPLAASGDYGISYVFRFSPTLQTFEVFTIPTAGAAPDGIAVRDETYPTEVWFAESGADRIGYLVYTNTMDYVLQEYELPAGSRPLNIVVDSTGDAWFTENGRSRIGYIDASTGITHEFPISTADVAPMDLDIAPDGSIWFTERATDHVGQLVVTSVIDFQIREFYVGWPNAGLSGVLAQGDDKIWVALSDQNRLARLKPSVPQVDVIGALTEPSYPLMLALSPDRQRMWFTELYGDYVSLFVISTNQYGLRYSLPTTNGHPYNLDVNSAGDVWFSEQLGGKIGRLALVPMGTFTEFPVPLPHARVQGLDVAWDDVVWFVADVWYTLNLPLILRQ